MLHYLDFGSAERSFVLLHGLFGSAGNWRGISRELATDYRVVVPDLRNHGKSPHFPSMTYRDMAEDVIELATHLGLQNIILCGHSMGGKVAMTLALQNPGLVRGLIALDIAPVDYGHSFTSILSAMSSLDPGGIGSRADADRVLAESVNDTPTRLFLLQNLVLQDGAYRWRINISVIEQYIATLTGFPADELGERTYTGPSLFLHGDRSDYVLPVHHGAIRRYFPAACVSTLEDAGHWVHSDQPARLLAQIRAFVTQTG